MGWASRTFPHYPCPRPAPVGASSLPSCNRKPQQRFQGRITYSGTDTWGSMRDDSPIVPIIDDAPTTACRHTMDHRIPDGPIIKALSWCIRVGGNCPIRFTPPAVLHKCVSWRGFPAVLPVLSDPSWRSWNTCGGIGTVDTSCHHITPGKQLRQPQQLIIGSPVARHHSGKTVTSMNER